MSDEKLHGTTECPICQAGSPHNHRTLEVKLHDRLIDAERQLDIERSAFMDSSEQSAKALGEARIRIKWLEGRLAEIANDRFMADLEAQVFAWVRDAIERQNIARAALAPRSERREGERDERCPRCQRGDHSAHGPAGSLPPNGCMWCKCGHEAGCPCAGCGPQCTENCVQNGYPVQECLKHGDGRGLASISAPAAAPKEEAK